MLTEVRNNEKGLGQGKCDRKCSDMSYVIRTFSGRACVWKSQAKRTGLFKRTLLQSPSALWIGFLYWDAQKELLARPEFSNHLPRDYVAWKDHSARLEVFGGVQKTDKIREGVLDLGNQ